MKTTGLDNDYERVIQVKVPKVPVNYEGRQQSNKHLPTLPEDSSSDAGPDSQIDNIMVGHQDHVVIPTKRPSVSLQVLANFTQYCPPARSRNLFWNWTLAVSRLFFFFFFTSWWFIQGIYIIYKREKLEIHIDFQNGPLSTNLEDCSFLKTRFFYIS